MTKEALSQPHGLTSAQAASTAIGEPWMHTHAVRLLEFTNCLHQEVISSILNKIEMPLSGLLVPCTKDSGITGSTAATQHSPKMN